MIDGNLQIMYFLMFSQNCLGFSFNFNDKIFNVASHFVFFIFFWFSVSCYFLYFILYKKLAKYFLDNTKCTISGIMFLVISHPFRQLLLSAIHNFLRYDYQKQLLMLLTVEVMYVIVIMLFLKITNLFSKLQIVWISMFYAGFRIILDIILFFQQLNYEAKPILELF